jgi:hypothetical protein
MTWHITLTVRVTSGEFAAIVEAATARGQSASEWLRALALHELSLPGPEAWEERIVAAALEGTSLIPGGC